MAHSELSEQQAAVHIHHARRRLVDNPEWLEYQHLEDHEPLEQQLWEAPEMNVLFMQSEAQRAQNPDRGMRSEASYMQNAVHVPEVIFLAEVAQPLRPKVIKKTTHLHLGQRMHMGIIYEEAGNKPEQLAVVDMQSLSAREQTSWHRKTSMKRMAQVMQTLDSAAHSIAEVRGPTKPKRFVLSNTAQRASRMKTYGNNFGETPATIVRRKQRIKKIEQQEQKKLALTATIYESEQDYIGL